MDVEATRAFVDTWKKSGGAERANYQLFLGQLASLVGAPTPEPTVPSEAANAYVFDKSVRFKHIDGTETVGFIDLYKRGCFVCEAKQSVKEGKRKADPAQAALFGDEDAGHTRSGTARVGTPGWDLAMERARRQAEGYAKALPKEHGWPPFLVIVDVGHCIELFADFSGQGKNYAQFPDRRTFRIMLADLERVEVRERLRLVWTDPHALDPAKRSAEVTRDIAERLAIVAKELEKKHDPQAVALFLMRCLFTMFAEDVELLPKQCFHGMLERFRGRADKLHLALSDLWQKMNTGGFAAGLEDNVRRFNGGLFKDATALPIDEGMLGELIVSARRDWRDVEPAIFGTLLERALSERERGQLGAHYTPRAYVERLVVPTIMEPLQEDWAAARVEAQQALDAGDKAGAIKAIRTFHAQLCNTRVLDPACGTGNFLYVSMELMKRLEGEVKEYLLQLGGQGDLELGIGEAKGKATASTVDPHNFLGIEINPRAKEIAELVLWIGFLKWQLRTNGQNAIDDPVLRDFKTIQWRDAVLTWDKQEILTDASGRPLSKWDGRTMKIHPITGEQIPDENAQLELHKYANPRVADWPEAEFIVGNPPFIGGKDIRAELGDGYAEALWASRSKRSIPKAADFVMYWWDQAAFLLVRQNSALRRFGFVTTNSITQTFNRRVVQSYMDGDRPISLAFAIPDHPWVKGEARANVRIAMTAARMGTEGGVVKRSIDESDLDTDAPNISFASTSGRIHADLTVGANVTTALPLSANGRIASPGVKLHGDGFIITPAEARALGLGVRSGLEAHIRPYLNGRDFVQTSRGKMVIDLFGLTESETRSRYPEVHQHVVQHVKPERDHNNRATYRDNWWIFGEPRRELRTALKGLPRYIATVETAQHRTFGFLPAEVLPDNKLLCIALSDAAFLAILSARAHCVWARAAGALLEDRPVYVKTTCFDPFPFPILGEEVRKNLAALGEELDRFRKERQAQHPSLTLTDMYNVLSKIKRDEPLTEAQKLVHDRGLIATLKRIHDEIDEAVAASYGWPNDLSDEAILERLVKLNRERVDEELRGLVRWLRPDFQNAAGATVTPTTETQTELDVEEAEHKPAFPESVAERARAVRNMLVTLGRPVTAKEVWQTFRNGGSYSKSVRELLETMTALGQAVEQNGSYFVL